MEGKLCYHQKFGFCKFKERCKNQHLEETFQELPAFLNTKSCHKRHPKECKQYEKGFCRFGPCCAYSHQEKSILMVRSNNTKINVKVEMLEKMVLEMAEKIMKLETKVKENKLKYASKTIWSYLHISIYFPSLWFLVSLSSQPFQAPSSPAFQL